MNCTAFRAAPQAKFKAPAAAWHVPTQVRGGFQATPEQIRISREVTEIVAGGGSACLTGHAGAGKTALTSHEVLPALTARGGRVAVVAFTHRACAVVRQKLTDTGIPHGRGEAIEVLTSSSLLGFREVVEEGAITFEPRAKPRVAEFTGVEVDEASMLPMEHVRQLQSIAADCGVGVLYVGDPAQLPPVGHKNPLSPAFELGIPHFHLSEVHRNAGPILQLATAARECEPGTLPPLKNAEAENGKVVVHPDVMAMGEAVGEKLLADMAAGVSDGFRVLAYTNRRVSAWNRACREMEFGADAPPFQEGDLLISRNAIQNWKLAGSKDEPPLTGASAELELVQEPELIELPLSNRLIAERLSAPIWRLRAVCDQTDDLLELIAVAPDDAPRVHSALQKLAAEAKASTGDESKRYWFAYFTLRRALGHFVGYRYASTVHKSQGGEWPCVFVDLDDISAARRRGPHSISPLEHRALTYVAFTRARHELHVVGG